MVLALEELPAPPGVTVSNARGYDREHAVGEHDRQEELTDFGPCVRVEVAVNDEQVENDALTSLS
jgi:nitrogen regulatory protein PII